MPITIGGVEVHLVAGVLRWTCGMAIDADGAPTAYAPVGAGLKPLDYLANAGKPGHWWGIVANSAGVPYVQQARDPAPGYYISPTALVDRKFSERDPRRYVDASRVPYIAIPRELKQLGAKLGDVALVTYRDRSSAAIVADIGPRGKVGEGSPALAAALGINPSARNGGAGAGVSYALFLGSNCGWPRTIAEVAAQVSVLAQPLIVA